MKKLQVISDIAVVAGCFVGIGFLSGKEAQTFVGNYANATIFAAVFCAANYIIREFCRRNNCGDTATLSRRLWGKFSGTFDTALCLCCFVCIVTVLAGIEQCLSQLLYICKIPLYSIAAAAIGVFVLRRGMSALKTANGVGIVCAIVLIIILYVTRRDDFTQQYDVPSADKSVIYALFTTTASLGVLTQLSAQSNAKQNVICAVGAAALLLLLTIIIMPLCNCGGNLPTLDGITNRYIKIYAMITLLICGVTGTVANAYPIVKQLHSVIPDDSLCAFMVYISAAAFGMFGFDFAVKAGYFCVSIMGAITVISIIYKNISEKRKISASNKMPPNCKLSVKRTTRAK